MATYKTQGIILRRKNFFEADRIITIFSKYQGKIVFLARGSRKILSKSGGYLEPFLVCNFILAEGKTWDILTSVEIVKSFKSISSDLRKTALAYKICELVDKVMVEKQESVQVYDLLHSTLGFIDENKFEKENLIFEFFALNLLAQIGFISDLESCLECGNKLKEETNYLGYEGGILCSSCGKSGKIVVEIKPNVVKLLKILVSSDIKVLKRINLEQVDTGLFKKIIGIYLQNVLEKELNSERFYKRMGR